MIQIFSILLFMSALLDQEKIFEKAAEKGFYYRFADISSTNECPEKEFCVFDNGKYYLISKKDAFNVLETSLKNSITIEITPDNNYVSYFLFVQHKSGVEKIQIKKKKVVIDRGIENIIKIQIVGTAYNGPRVIWEKTLKKPPVNLFFKTFDKSLVEIRKFYNLKPLKYAKELESAANNAIKRIKNDGLVHYSSKTGSVRHSGINKKILGENLFVAESEEKGWNMTISSPSHLYNLLNPDFKKYHHAVSKEENVFYGATIFSE